jgi:hypothetical protein
MGKAFKETFGEKTAEVIKKLPSFKTKYQSWYSEALALLRQLLQTAFLILRAITMRLKDVKVSPTKVIVLKIISKG